MPALADPHDRAATEVTSPQLGEAIIRDVWPSVAAYPGPAGLARACYRTIFLAPIGWLVLAPLYFMKLVTDANSEFFVAGRLDVIDADGKMVLSLPGVPEAESVRLAILQAAAAWGPVLKSEKK